jgi:hypothetical protein
MSAPPPPYKNVYLSWQGTGFTSGYQQNFDVLCGKNPPTIIDGYARWTTDDRYLQRGLTIFEGYNPTRMKCEIIFGAWSSAGGWNTSDAAGEALKTDIDALEWMAGGNFQFGPSPVVYVYSHSNQGGDTDLIPSWYAGRPWIINGAEDGLSWGNAIRNPNGYRIWQEATVTLTNYLNLTKAPPPDNNMSGGYFVTTPARNTALKIAAAPSANSPLTDQQILARRILNAPQNNPCKSTSIKLAGKSINWAIRAGVHVFVPGHQVV